MVYTGEVLICGSLVKPSLVPYDKFKLKNLEKADEYLQFLADINPTRLKFGDKKLLKGAEVYCCKARRNTLTGEVPVAMAPSDFQNTYSIIGFCGIDTEVDPVCYRIHNGPNDSEHFAVTIEATVALGWLHRGDILVLDNAVIHHEKENSVLARIWILRVADCERLSSLRMMIRTPYISQCTRRQPEAECPMTTLCCKAIGEDER
jgi:hypothetical protein